MREREHGNLGGDWARDAHRGGLTDEYARDGGWSGAGRHDNYARDYGFRGKGPKHWTADERIRALVNDHLTEHDEIDASDIDVSVASGEVTLAGTCGTRREKRLAEDLAWACGGVHDVHNRLAVTDREKAIGKASE